METHKLLGFLGILREAHKTLSKNGKLTIFITLFTLSLFSLLLLSNTLSTKPLLSDFINKFFLLFTNFKGPAFTNLLTSMKNDLRFFVGLEWIFLLATIFASIITSIVTIFVSATAYVSLNSTFNDLVLRALRSYKRPLITWFYTSIFNIGYTLLMMLILIYLVLITQNRIIFISLSILAAILYAYFAVDWTLALVVSVLEERCGIDAISKAKRLYKGMEINGFALNFVFTMLFIIILQFLRLIDVKQSTSIHVIIGLVVVNFMCLVRMFWLTSYTVFYYHCKRNHGEEVELHERMMEYIKLPSKPLIDVVIP